MQPAPTILAACTVVIALACVGEPAEPAMLTEDEIAARACEDAAAAVARCVGDPSAVDCAETSEAAQLLDSPVCRAADGKFDTSRLANGGEGCTVDGECVSPLTCLPIDYLAVPHVCGELAPENGPCDSSPDCAGGLLCLLGDLSDGTRVLRCTQCTDDVSCGEGFVCRAPDGVRGCLLPAVEGEVCEIGDCASGLSCESGSCMATGPRRCTSDAECPPETCRFVSPGTRTCASPSRLGGYCDDEADCDGALRCRWDRDRIDRRCDHLGGGGGRCDPDDGDDDCGPSRFCSRAGFCYDPIWLGYGGGGGGCFAAGTPVDTPDGERAIDALQVGDAVLTYDADSDRVVEGRVERLWVHDAEPVGRVVLDDGTVLATTPNHPFFRVDRGAEGVVRCADSASPVSAQIFLEASPSSPMAPCESAFDPDVAVVDAAMLRPGDVVLVRGGGALRPATVRLRSFDRGRVERVYNVTVTPHHTYFAASVLVHNK